jgi:hypothetical protein
VQYISPAHYKVDIGDTIENVTSIELKGIILPKSSYNVNNSNKFIDFNIGSTITGYKITNPGSNYATPPVVSMPVPELAGGVQAVATAIIDTLGRVTGLNITNPGSGYIASVPQTIYFSAPSQYGNINSVATAIAIVGTAYTAVLRPAQYTIGGNPSAPGGVPSNLLLEIQNAMNYAVNGAPYNIASTSPFQVRLVSQYPELGATSGEPNAYDTNGAQFNRIQITNTTSAAWELLFASGPNRNNSAHSVLGFPWQDQSFPTTTLAVSTIISAGTTLRASFDYNLVDDPKYVVVSFLARDEPLERLTSGSETLNRTYCTLFFDSNPTEVITDTTGTLVSVVDPNTGSNVNYLSGLVTKGTFWFPQGTLKPIKGTDYDNKKLTLSPAIGKLTSLEVQITCYGHSNGGTPILYDFMGRDNTFIFEVQCDDYKAGLRG